MLRTDLHLDVLLGSRRKLGLLFLLKFQVLCELVYCFAQVFALLLHPTVGVSANIVDASFEALLDAIQWKLVRDGAPSL